MGKECALILRTGTTKTLAATEFLDHDNPAVQEFVARVLKDGTGTPTAKAVLLYYAVRDQILYEVYGADLTREGLRASFVLDRGRGFCIHKAIVYAAACRGAGIPSRLVFADVRNHLASPRLRELVGGDVFRFHAFTSIYLEGRWLRATPVFNRTLCRLYGLTPLDFDGTSDCVYHAYDADGRKYMEFLHEHGEFDDFPYDLVVDGIRSAHPRLFAERHLLASGSLSAEAPSDRRSS
jgi:transglutaminase-like putative cysteine protease